MKPDMTQQLISRQVEFEDLCDHMRESRIVAFDTEFVSEYSYRPELGLLQFATKERCVAVDPYEVENIHSWWEIMSDDETTVVVHGGRAEVLFCITLGGKTPQKLVDVQIAEGLRSLSFPLSYSALLKRILGKDIHGKETRTDWKRRPLSEKQIRYALDDVTYLLPIWDRQEQSLSQLNRLGWAQAEFQRMIREVEADHSRESWSKLPGIHKLNPREFAVAVELADWRKAEASSRNRPLKQVLRDDLLIELACRQPRSFQQLLATRDMNRRNYKQSSSDFLKCIEKGLSISDSELPQRLKSSKREDRKEEQILGQLLGIALSNRCAEMNVAKSIVGTSEDLRGLVRWHLGNHGQDAPPRLAEGWRAEVCGNILADLLDGRISLRVSDPHSSHPLVFEKTDTKK
jgi:ribonuclease D